MTARYSSPWYMTRSPIAYWVGGVPGASVAGGPQIVSREVGTSGYPESTCWQFHLAQEHERVHRSRYAEGDVPDPLPPPRPTLRLVK